ncbi:FAD-dependent oxidoreductase [Pokkaliibacter plantistimulans]|uniref:FAD-dependent oxidoreductase n=1 Tax=Proteobacteria bacterium 228 TaxID=2083153 RepID=A0A2S5KLX7_9PROT|nr:FAD-binding oxidoreductase [Pokkaliibacter plantistimulans]PPC75834.1 FAD-dependent oxidoreductase [Pokkaliibacter plantistimulans]
MNNKDIIVKRLPKDPGPAAWHQILPPAPEYPMLVDDKTVDWAIVGGGFAGLAAARRLAQLCPGESIALLEARRLAEGPGGRNSGFMIDLPHELTSDNYAGARDHDLQQIRLNRAAIDYAREIALELGMGREVFDPCGKMTASASAKGNVHIESYRQHLESLGEPYKIWNARELQQWTGTDFYQQGIFTPGAVMIQPAAFLRLTAQGISSRVQIFENSPVLRIEQGAEHTLHSRHGRLRAKRVILAVNGHIQSFGFFPRQVLHVFTYASMTRRLTAAEVATLGGVPDWGILPADPVGTTVRRVSDCMGSGDRIVIRNHVSLNQDLEARESNLQRAARLQDDSFARRFPMLKGVAMEHRWGGRLCLTMNSVPAFGEVEERIWSACAQNGLGTVKGTLSGMMAAEIATQQQSPLLSDFLAHNPPQKLVPEPFLSLGGNLTMRFKEWQAGADL